MTERSFLKRDIENLRIILKYCDDIEHFIELYGSEEAEFCDNLSLQYGCVFSLEQIGEHVKRLSYETKNKYPDIDWKNAAGMRDFIAHNYSNIDISRVRLTVLNKIPSLRDVCRSILSGLS
ncbi:MAG: DUF86 domain-containing protein [Methanomassiliicoccaceae archaeon]|nr:DUF86 domain-containing protein [Methanomassiliicoccaceae archaeon]